MKSAARALLAAFLFVSAASAEVVGVDIDVHEDVLGGKSYGLAGAYEKFIGTMHFAVDPTNSANEIIVDIEHAPKNADGLVEFSATFTLIQPKDVTRGNGTMLLGVANRGTRRMLTFFNHADSPDEGPWDADNPTLPIEYGDGFLMEQGFTLLWVGWQFDVPVSRVAGSRVFVPRAQPGDEPIIGMVRSDFVVRERTFDRTLADRNHVPYPVSNPDAEGTVMTVRNAILGERRAIPRDQWAFARVENERVIPDMNHVYLETGFEPFLIYEVIYEGENPEVIGLGLAGLRDAASLYKYGSMEDINLAAGAIENVVGYGMSQPGRTLRTLVYMGFNEDEQHRKAFDGIIAQIGGAARGSFNLRFGQASRDAHHYLNFFYPTDIFPFADIEMTDPVTGQTDSMLERVPNEFRPKVYNVNSSYEYWGRAVSLLTTNLDGTEDIPMMDDARVYHLAGAEHLPAAFPPSVEDGQNRNNPNDFSWLMRALLIRMHEWVTDGTLAPASQYPRIDEGSLVQVEAFDFPELPGIAVPGLTHMAHRVDYGPQFESDGIIANEPPEFIGPSYTILVPQVNEDGNELSGLHTPGGLVPLATYTGWNLYNDEYGPTHLNAHMSGSFLPFPTDRAAREASGDPRLSIEERYASKAEYLGLMAAEAETLIEGGYLLDQDLREILAQAGEIWDYVTR